MKVSTIRRMLCCSVLLSTGVVHAQSNSMGGQGSAGTAASPTAAGDASSSPLQEIVVTAQKRSENLQRVPVAVTVISGGALASNAIDTTLALPKITPNLQVGQFANYSSPYIRGIGTRIGNAGLESSVATYLDDQYLPRSSAGFFTFSDISRIEVLKGPQGTLYGRNATGGAIRLLTNDPTDYFYANGSLTAGSYGRKGVSATVNSPVTDTLSVRLAGQWDANNGYVTRTDPTLPKVQDRDQLMFRGKVLWKPTDRLSVKLSADFSRKYDHEGQAFINLFDTAPEQIGLALGGTPTTKYYQFSSDLIQHGAPYKFLQQAAGAALRIDYELEGATLSSITGYRWDRFRGAADLDATDANLLHGNQKTFTHDYTQEFQIVSNNSGRLSYVGGLFLFYEKSYQDFMVFGGGVDPSGLANFTAGAVKTYSIAPYGEATYKFSDLVSLTVGARYTAEKKKLLFNDIYLTALGANLRPTGAMTLLASETESSLKFNQFTPKAVLSLTPVRHTLFYASYSKGFKSGGYSLPAFAVVDQVKPEQLTSYEIGWKSEFGPVRFNGAAFDYDYKNLQTQLSDPVTSASRIRNAATARVRGAEADVLIQASKLITLKGGVGYLDAKYRKYPSGEHYILNTNSPACTPATPASCLGLSVVSSDLSGNRLPYSSKYSGYAGIDVNIPVSEDIGKVTVSGLGSYSSKSYFDPGNGLSNPSRWLISGSIGWKDKSGRFGLSVFGDNLTDKHYASDKEFEGTGGFYVPAPPRTIGVRLSVATR